MSLHFAENVPNKGAQNQNFRVNITAVLSICKHSFKTLSGEGRGVVAIIKWILKLFFFTSFLYGLKIVVPALACSPFAGYFLYSFLACVTKLSVTENSVKWRGISDSERMLCEVVEAAFKVLFGILLTVRRKPTRSLSENWYLCWYMNPGPSAYLMGACHAAAAPSRRPDRNLLKKHRFSRYDPSNVLDDLPYSRNQQLKSADEQYSGIVKIE